MRSLFEDFGVSSILVIGGSGDYFQVTVKTFRIALTSCSIIRSSATSARLAKISLENKHLRKQTWLFCDDSVFLAFYVVDKVHFQVTGGSAVEVNI